jgi:hypothetical protein
MRAHFNRSGRFSQLIRAVLTLTLAAAGIFAFDGAASAAPPPFVPVNGAAYYLRQDVSLKCLDVIGAANVNGARLQRWTCGPQWNQQFLFTDPDTPSGVLSWRIRPRYSPGKCLDVTGGSWNPGTPLQIWDCNSGWQQRFQVIQGWSFLPYTTYYLKAIYINLCIQIINNGYNDGGDAVVEPCDARAGELFDTFDPNA